MAEITQARLKEILNYDPLTGVFTRLVAMGRHGRWRKGTVAGYKDKDGYVNICIDYKHYKAHRLAWLYVHGEWPEDQLDHKNLATGDNPLINLREANNSQNNANKPRQSNNTSGYKGVSWNKGAKRWRSQLLVNGVRLHLGYFDTSEAAHAEYCQAIKKHHGEFARTE